MVLGHYQGTVVQMFKREMSVQILQGGEGHNKPAHEVLEELSADISRRWLGGYAGLEDLTGIIGTAMLGVSAAEMMLGTAVRMFVLSPGEDLDPGWQRHYGARPFKWSSCPAGGPWSGGETKEK